MHIELLALLGLLSQEECKLQAAGVVRATQAAQVELAAAQERRPVQGHHSLRHLSAAPAQAYRQMQAMAMSL